MKQEHKDSLTAAAVTIIVTAILLLILFFCRIGYEAHPLSESVSPELLPLDDEEMFLTPELIQDAGEPESALSSEAAPVAQGKEEAASAPRPLPEAQTAIATEKPSRTTMKKGEEKADAPAKEPAPDETVRNREKEKAGENVRKGFAKPSSTAGAGGSGVGISGSAPGRRFLGCDKPDIALREKTTVTVSMTVDASGHVTSVGEARGGTAEMQARCKAAAHTARWSAKKGAAPTPATITFTITPRK